MNFCGSVVLSFCFVLLSNVSISSSNIIPDCQITCADETIDVKLMADKLRFLQASVTDLMNLQKKSTDFKDYFQSRADKCESEIKTLREEVKQEHLMQMNFHHRINSMQTLLSRTQSEIQGLKGTGGLRTSKAEATNAYTRQGNFSQAMLCEEPSNPVNGRAVFTSRNPQSILTYECDEGFRLSPGQPRVCNQLGQWNGTDPVCEATSCRTPVNPENGRAIYASLKSDFKVTYVCNEGYRLSSNITGTCVNGEWSGGIPVCTEIVCEKPGDLLNGKASYAGLVYGSTVTYECDVGLELSFQQARVCGSDGKWSGTEPSCKAIHAGEICEESGDQPKDCSDVYLKGNHENGVYGVCPENRVPNTVLLVYCDMSNDGGGWTVIQQRRDFDSGSAHFYEDWNAYKAGFGDLQKNFWIGNDNINYLTNQRDYQIKFDLKDKDNKSAYAIYDEFRIEDESNNYKLHLKGYNGTAGDSFGKHDRAQFTTKDRDNDITPVNCAQKYIAAWWYTSCGWSSLNGIYSQFFSGIFWHTFSTEGLTSSVMKIKPMKSSKPT